MDKLKLIKILSLTTSSNDSEALSAIRKANEFIVANKLNWNTIFIEPPQSTSNDDFTEMYCQYKKLIQLHNEEIKEYENTVKFSLKIIKNLILLILAMIVVYFIWG